MKDLSFKRGLKSRPVTILEDEPKLGESPEPTHELREMKASVREKYMDRLSARLQLNAKGDIIGVKKYDGMHIDLLTQCLYELKDGKLITAQALADWPSGTVAQLFEAAQELNHMRKPSERNSILAEQLVKWFKNRESGSEPTAEEIEDIIQDTDKRLFDQKNAEED
jgi:hypothetical protein